MSRNQGPALWISLLGVAMISTILSREIGGISSVGTLIFVTIAGISTVAAMVIVAWPRVTRDKYDLNTLRRVHDQAELRAIDDELSPIVAKNGGNVCCPCCGHLYGERLPACPECKRVTH